MATSQNRFCYPFAISKNGSSVTFTWNLPSRPSRKRLPPWCPRRVPASNVTSAPGTMSCSSKALQRRMTPVSYVESGQPQGFPIGSSPTHQPREERLCGHLFFWSLHQEVSLSSDFVVHPIRRDRCPLVAADSHAHDWLTLQPWPRPQQTRRLLTRP
jgi:hypothetical protein